MTTRDHGRRFRGIPFTVALLTSLLAVLAVSAGCGRGGKAPATKMTAAEADSLLKAYAKDRSETDSLERSSPMSYFATVQRQDFGDKTALTVGSAPGNDVRVEDPGVRPHHLRATVVGDSFHVETLDPKARFQAKSDSNLTMATLPPSSIKVGRFTMRLSHQRFPAIIVFDPQSPRFKEYRGMKWFPPDLAYHIVAPLTPNPSADTTIILSTRGNRRRAVRVGWFDFEVKGAPVRLEADRLLEPGVGEKDLSVLFTDATTGKETYHVGRYVDPVQLPDGRYVLDFNYCYNPACAFSVHYNCPIPPAANHLNVPIEAGELDDHYMH